MYNLVRNHDLKLQVINNMQSYGGSFVKSLSRCLLVADEHNLAKLEFSFYDYIEKYHPKNWQTDTSRVVDILAFAIEKSLDRKVYEIEKIFSSEYRKSELTKKGKQDLKDILSKELF